MKSADIQMYDLSGIDLEEQLLGLPDGYDRFILDGFCLNVTDYI